MASNIINSKTCVLHVDENNLKSEFHVFTEKTLEMCNKCGMKIKNQKYMNNWEKIFFFFSFSRCNVVVCWLASEAGNAKVIGSCLSKRSCFISCSMYNTLTFVSIAKLSS